jgi:hypothetical protein
MGRFPLMQAAIFGYVECIHTCVAKGAALKQTDHRGMTALMAAASTGQAGAVAALLACGADPLQVRPFVNECAPQAGGMRSTRCKKLAHVAVSRRRPISLYTMVPRTEGYTHAAKVWDLSIVQGPFSVAPRQTLT